MLNSIITAPMTAGSFFVCIAAALALGVLTALVFGRGSFHTGSYSVTLALLPAVVVQNPATTNTTRAMVTEGMVVMSI